MSVLGLERSATHQKNEFDHPINLVDSTEPTGGGQDYEVLSPGSEGVSKVETGLSRQFTRSSLRKQLAQRKYAKYQKDDDSDESAAVTAGTIHEENEVEASASISKQKTGGAQSRLRDRIPFKSKKKQRKHETKNDTFIDVLYENQRGCFLCGIPLYSARSLLNFDPAEWQNSQFQDSAVDIKDAQLPDPSWRWVWRTWYVDMSHDVDEQGWEYSFNFSPRFAWHGSHPWFHSFVRRRRWLRKREKVHSAHIGEKREGRGFKDAHKLNSDYFTIHAAAKERSRETSADRTTTHRSSFMGSFHNNSDDDEKPEDITDIPTLLVALKKARVDREKIMGVKSFLEHGGEEIHYLPENIELIMDELIHQTSRRQLQHVLLEALDKALNAEKDESEDKDTRDRRISNITKAVEAAGVHINDQDYWSDLQNRTSGIHDGGEKGAQTDTTHALDASKGVDVEGAEEVRTRIKNEEGNDGEIKGISKDAEIEKAPGLRRPDTMNEKMGDYSAEKDQKGQEEGEEVSKKKPVDKGKARETA